jgi:hypothetical protein
VHRCQAGAVGAAGGRQGDEGVTRQQHGDDDPDDQRSEHQQAADWAALGHCVQVVQPSPGHGEQAEHHDEPAGQTEPPNLLRHVGDGTEAAVPMDPA